MRKFRNTENEDIAEQVGDTCWYQIKKTNTKMNYQLPIWCLTEFNEWTNKNPWIEIK
jgi:hypothetical protein